MKRQRVPLWMTILIIVVMLPVAAFPALLSAAQAANANLTFVWLYPVYALACGYLAWQCYGRRTEMTWILLFLLALTHVSMWILVRNNCI